MGGQSHAPAALYPGKRRGTHCVGGWVGLRNGLDTWHGNKHDVHQQRNLRQRRQSERPCVLHAYRWASCGLSLNTWRILIRGSGLEQGNTKRSGTARFFFFAPWASSHNGRPIQKLRTLKSHKYILEFPLLGSAIKIAFSAVYIMFSFKYSFYRPFYDALDSAVGGGHITRPSPSSLPATRRFGIWVYTLDHVYITYTSTNGQWLMKYTV
jgi:hypothetical protein